MIPGLISAARQTEGGGDPGGELGSYRHYRLYFIPNFLNNSVIATVELRNETGGADVLAGASSLSFSQTLVSGTMADLTDGNASTSISFSRGCVWAYLDIDLGTPQVIEEVMVKAGTSGSVFPDSLMFFGSNDNITFTPLYGRMFIARTSVLAGDEFLLSSPGVGSALTWGITCILSGDPSWLYLTEVEFRSTLGGADEATGGTPRASYASSLAPPADAFDGTLTESWISQKGTNTPQQSHAMLGYTFGSPKDIAQISIQARTGTTSIRETFDFAVFKTNEDCSFLISDSTTGGSNGVSGGILVDFVYLTVGNYPFTSEEVRTYDLAPTLVGVEVDAFDTAVIVGKVDNGVSISSLETYAVIQP